MYAGSLELGKIVNAFERCVPGCYVRDYRDRGGYVTLCRGYRNILWGDQADAGRVYRQIPNETLGSFPVGNVTAATHYHGIRLTRPGWRVEFRKAAEKLTRNQLKRITKILGMGEVFTGVR